MQSHSQIYETCVLADLVVTTLRIVNPGLVHAACSLLSWSVESSDDVKYMNQSCLRRKSERPKGQWLWLAVTQSLDVKVQKVNEIRKRESNKKPDLSAWDQKLREVKNSSLLTRGSDACYYKTARIQNKTKILLHVKVDLQTHSSSWKCFWSVALCKHPSDTHVHLCVSMPGEQSESVSLSYAHWAEGAEFESTNQQQPVCDPWAGNPCWDTNKHTVGPTEKPVTVWARRHVSAALKQWPGSREQLTLWMQMLTVSWFKSCGSLCLCKGRFFVRTATAACILHMYVWLWKRERCFCQIIVHPQILEQVMSSRKILHWT